MSTADDPDQVAREGFWSRWSRRKTADRHPPPEPASPSADGRNTSTGAGFQAIAPDMRPAASPVAAPAMNDTAEARAPLPPVESLTPEDDFVPFMAGDVAPGLRNQAMKKLFADPHFNVMDGLDVYIDDYGKPDPLPAEWLRKMAQSRLLGLFDDDKEQDDDKNAKHGDVATTEDSASITGRTTDDLSSVQLQRQPIAGGDASVPGVAEGEKPDEVSR